MQLELVERARAGDREAFSLLVRASTPRVYGAARLILRDPDRAQDAVQEAFVLAWRHVRALRDPQAWDSWLYRLTVRACTRMAKKGRTQDLVELQLGDEWAEAVDRDFATQVAERDRLGRELGRLPLDQRTVMVLHFYLDLPLSDAAAILGVPIGTAKSRLHRGLATMRASLEPERPDLRVVSERSA
jgi:RNA polymerase sigma-70 factor (ECF subfamily)